MGNIPHRLLVLLITATLALLSGACASKTQFGVPVEGEVVSVEYALTEPAIGRTVVLQGALHGVCQDEGCFFTLSDQAHEILIRYTGENGLGIPIVARGRARVRGQIRDTIIGRNRVSEVRATGVELLGE